jgi:peptidoglycan-associated lipoprotein
MDRQIIDSKITKLGGLAIAGILTLLAGCHKQVAVAHPPAAPQPAVAQTTPPATPKPAVVTETSTVARSMPDEATKATIQSLLDRIQDVYFDYNKHVLRPDAESTLLADAKTLREILAQYPTYKLTVEGFCDERGSEEYNLALGDERAKQAEDYLETLGIPASQLRAVSYGKEDPVCTEHTESCWQRNRRAHITQQQPS